MPLVSQTYAGQFLNAGELIPIGQRRAAAIHAVTLEPIGQGAETKQVLVLELVSPTGKAWPKKVVLNKTNSVQLAAGYGDNTDGWTGKPVEVWAENVMFQGRMVPGIKVMPAHQRTSHAAPLQHQAGNGGALPAATQLASAIPGVALPQPPLLNQQIDPLLDDEIPF